jgi:hypothetical protein
MVKLGRFFALPPAERNLLLQSAVLLPLMALGLRLYGFQRWFARLDRSANKPTLLSSPEFRPSALRGQVPPSSPSQSSLLSPQSSLLIAKRTAALVLLTTRYTPFHATCLHRSLTLWWLLRRQGIPGDLRIGVRHQNGLFEAHAWVEYQSTVLNDTPDVNQRFAAFDQVIAPPGLKFH